MFQSEDWVWHDKYGRGNVAAPSGSMTYVLWDDMSKNEFLETAPPTTEDAEGNEIVTGPSELVGRYIYVDEAAIQAAHDDYKNKKLAPKQESEQPFMFFAAGWFKVLKVDQKFIFRWNEEEQRYKPRPVQGQYILTLQDAEGAKVHDFVTKEPGFYVPNRYSTDMLSKIMEEGF